MTRIIAVAIPKGGTGKTTTTINLGAALAELGQRVLLVDFDPSGSLTQALGVQPEGLTIYSAISDYLATYEPRLAPRRPAVRAFSPAGARRSAAPSAPAPSRSWLRAASPPGP